MAEQTTATLVRLSDTHEIVADPAQDIRGRTVRDAQGEDLGKVDDLLVDTGEGKVRFLRVESGGVLGIGATPSFIPVEAVVDVGEEIHIDQSADKVAEAPRYAPDIVEPPETDYYDRVYGYYGYAPFWGPVTFRPPAPRPAVSGSRRSLEGCERGQEERAFERLVATPGWVLTADGGAGAAGNRGKAGVGGEVSWVEKAVPSLTSRRMRLRS